jgi:hypothetical protein
MRTIEEQITENITEKLSQIRINAGDNFNATSDDAEQQGNSSLPAFITLQSDETLPITGTLGRDIYRKTYHVECPVGVSDDATTDTTDRTASRIAGDVVKALQDDYQWGALALNTRIRKIQYGLIGEQMYGAVVTFEVDFWTLKDNPFEQ